MSLSNQQIETFVYSLRSSVEQLQMQQKQQNQALNGLIVTVSELGTATPTSNNNGLDTYLVSGGILHKLVTTFNALVVLGAALTVTGVLKVLGVSASLPLKVDASNNVISALISLTSEVSGILGRSNGGLGNNAATAYAGTCSGSFSGTVTGGTCSGSFSGTTSTTV